MDGGVSWRHYIKFGITTMTNPETTYASDLVPEGWIRRSCGYHEAVAWFDYDDCMDCYEHWPVLWKLTALNFNVASTDDIQLLVIDIE